MIRPHLRTRAVSAAIGILIVGCLTLRGQSSAPADSVASVQALVDQGQYRPALKQIATMLPGAQQTDPASQQDRFDLLMMRGECLLQLGMRADAVMAFNSAGRAAPSPPAAAIARATEVLIRRSTNNLYKPAGGGPGIDIRPAESRLQAEAALYADLSAAVQPKLQAALESSTLQNMIDLLPTMVDLDSIEYAYTGKDTQTAAQLKEMGNRARALMTCEIRRVGLRFDELVALSDANWGPNYTITGGITRRTFTTPQANELNSLLAYVKKIDQTARQGREFAHEMGHTGDAWEPVIADADDLIDRFNAVMGP
jgi:hypothetical protein